MFRPRDHEAFANGAVARMKVIENTNDRRQVSYLLLENLSCILFISNLKETKRECNFFLRIELFKICIKKGYHKFL